MSTGNEKKPFNWAPIVLVVGFLFVLFLALSDTLESKLVYWIGGGIAVVFIVSIIGWLIWKWTYGSPDWRRGLLFAVGITIGTIVVAFTIRALNVIASDKTPISPTVVFVICIAASFWMGKMLKTDKNAHRVYQLWFVYGTLMYSFYFHLTLWLFPFASSLVISFLLLAIYRRLKRTDGRGKHKLFEVLFSCRKKINVFMVILFLLDFFVVPATLVYMFGFNNWWHGYTTTSAYISGLWLCYALWKKFYFVDISEKELVSLPNVNIVRLREKKKKED